MRHGNELQSLKSSGLLVLLVAVSIFTFFGATVSLSKHSSSGIAIAADLLSRPNADTEVIAPGDGQDTTKTKITGGESRRARALLRRRSSIDTTSISLTSKKILDSLRALPRDSSARLAQFKHVRRDFPMVIPLQLKTHSLYLPEPTLIHSVETLDSTRYVYRLRRIVGSVDTKIPLEMNLEEYSTLRLKKAIRSNWEKLAQAYELAADKKKGLGELFGSVTNIEIPIPKNPLFSIFGPNIIRLQINGAVDIHAGFSNTQSDLFINNPLAQSRNEPNFNQEVQVNVKGEIGDKLKIDADWNTHRQFEYENQLKVRYTGYEDEIVQSVEAGNVSLNTTSSFIGSSAALFGIKTAFQFGPLKLTTVASQKKGQIRELSVSGGGRPTEFVRRATDYSQDHYFIDTSYVAWFDSVFLYQPSRVNPEKEVRDIEVWVTRIGNNDPNERDVVAFLDEQKVLVTQGNFQERASEFTAIPGEVEVGRFVKLDPNDYTFNKYAGYITLNRSLQPEQALAVTYTVPVKGDITRNMDVGNFGSRDTSKSIKLIMKLVRPKFLGPQFKAAWRMMLKNIYPLGGRGIKKEGFELHIKYEVSGRDPLDNLDNLNLIEMFGLDRYGENPGSPPDGKFDYTPGLTINEARGELIFPRTEPFREGIRQFFLSKGRTIAEADSFIFREVYDTTFNGATNSQRNKFLIKGTITSSIASTYQIGFNVVEGSVDVLVNGAKTKLGEDFTVDYISGTVTIKNQAYLEPGTNLQIRYEANDLFQLASKSLLGARGEVALGKNSILGFTILNLSQQTLSDKVRLGEEPVSNIIMGIDGGTEIGAPFLTRVLNWLPGIQTNALSSISLKGEAAYMSPDPNTRKSPITQDAGQGLAYIDDFEGSRRTIPLSIGYGAWRDASPPDVMPALDVLKKLKPEEKIEYKAAMSWYNIVPSDVAITILKPAKIGNTVRGEEQVTVLNLYFRPQERGPFNYSMNLDEKLFANRPKAWAGIQKSIGSTSTNLLDENVNFIEFWVHLDKTQPTVKLRIDLGLISEDVIPNGELDTEDGVDGLGRSGAGTLRAGEDVGLDGLTNDQEKIKFANFIAKYKNYASDPSGDDWVRPAGSSILPSDYKGINGTENNAQADVGRFPDTEDLNRNNVVDRVNSYFEYEIPLDTNNVLFQKYVTGGANQWYQIRIPIIDTTRNVGSPSFATIQDVRLWLSGAQDEVVVRLTEFNLVGNQWEELVKNDSTFRASVVNREDNPNYVSPPQLPLAKDRTRPDQDIKLNEQSLNLIINGLKDGETRQVIKRFPVRPLDLFSYRTMKMFVHGDDRPGFQVRYGDSLNYDLEVFLRFGADSLNYYEYRAPIHPGWDPGNNDVVIKFSEITAIKLGRDSLGALSARVPVPNGPPGATYQVKGEPTLTNVRWISIGVENPANKRGTTAYVGEVWVNELRLTEVDDTPGWAYRFETTMKLADVATVSLNLTQRDPHFHALEERLGTRLTERNWALTTSVGLERFLPQSWGGTTLGFTYTHSEQIQNPKYQPGTDILVDAAVQRTADIQRTKGNSEAEITRLSDSLRLRTQTLAITEAYSLPNIKFNVPVDYWLISETINRMSFAYSYNKTTRRSPTTESLEQWQWNVRAGYGIQLSERNFIQPFAPFGDFFLFSPWKGLKVFFLPRNLNVSATLIRSQAKEQTRDQTASKPVVRNFAASRSMSFSWQFTDGGLLNLGADYSLDIQSSLLNFEVDQFGRQRSFSDILGDMFGKSRLIDFGVDQSYGQTISFNSRPVLPSLFKLDKFFATSLRYSSRYEWVNNLQAGDLGKSVQNNGNLTFTLDVNVKTIGNEIWGTKPLFPDPIPGDTTGGKSSFKPFELLDRLSRILIKIPFFDFDKLSISFTQTNRSQNSGVIGSPGFLNIFGRVPFFQESMPDYGPSLLYQLGLSSDPNGRVIIQGKRGFPFFTGHAEPGLRAPRGNLVDIFSQSNRINMRTSRTLWDGANLEVNWNVGWSYNVNRTIQSDSLGVPFESNRVVSGDVDRSYLSFPPILFFKFLRTSIEDVQKQYEQLRVDAADTRTPDAKLAQAFEEGFEALPLMKKILGNILPRPNWTLRWEGLEHLPVFSSFASRVSLDHSYTSGYKRRWKLSPNGEEVTESQQVTYGFSPLIGLNFTFKELFKGNFGASFRYGISTNYDLTPSAQNIVEGNLTEINVTANFSRQGFEIPFFGLSLSNDLDISFSYSHSKNERKMYDMQAVNFKKDGTPLESSGRTSLEPRIRYILSSRVTAAMFYKYTKQEGSRIPGQTINELGIDVRVAIQP
ncbi:MAG: cell surface protein SprA [Ignavibacteriales bacterium]|nr:cell surface protein SprA [Ignavibacteriales bacterium]